MIDYISINDIKVNKPYYLYTRDYKNNKKIYYGEYYRYISKCTEIKITAPSVFVPNGVKLLYFQIGTLQKMQFNSANYGIAWFIKFLL